METNQTRTRTSARILLVVVLLFSAAVQAQEESDSNFSLDIYGFIMIDSIYDFDRVDPDWNDTLRPSKIPTEKGVFGSDGEFIGSVRQSRLSFNGGWDNDGDPFNYLFEWELFGVGDNAGKTTPRLRHAWLNWRGFGAGQTWSAFMDPDVFPNTIDYWGPAGMVFIRNYQLRYTFSPNEDTEWIFALEDQSTAIDVGIFGDISPEFGDAVRLKDNVPNLVAHYRKNTGFGHYQVAGVLRKLEFDTRDTPNNEPKDKLTGWGINLSTVINMAEKDHLRLQLVFGEGYGGNYINDGGVDIAPHKSEARTVWQTGIVAYYDHYWSDKWSSTIGYSTNIVDNTNQQLSDELHKGQIAQLNLLHYPSDNWLVGGEMIWGKREDKDGDSGTDFRVQLSFKWYFTALEMRR